MPNIRLLDFSGGMMRTTSRFLQRDNQLSLSINNHGDNIGSLTKRPGFKKVGGTFQASKNIDAVASGVTYLYAGSNNSGGSAGQLKYNNSQTAPLSGTWTAVSGGTAIPTNIKYEFVPFPQASTLVIAGAKENPTVNGDFMATLVVNEATPGTSADATNAPRSKFVKRFRDRVYHGFCSATWPDGAAVKPQRVAFSRVPQAGVLRYVATSGNGAVTTLNGAVAIGATSIVLTSASSFATEGSITLEDEINITYTGKTSNTLTGIPVSGPGSIQRAHATLVSVSQLPYFDFFDVDAPIRGMEVSADALWVWTATGMWRYTQDSLKKLFPIGCASHRSIRTVDIYTMWYDGQTVWAFSGGKPEDIGRPIYTLLRQVASPTTTFAAAPDNDHYRLYVGSLTIDDITYNNCFLQYTVSSNRWDIYSLSIYDTAASDTVTSAGIFNDTTKTRMFFGTSKGQIYRLGESYDLTADQIYSDGDQTGEKYPIQWLVKTKKYDFGEPEEMKSVTAYHVFSTRGVGMKLGVNVDNERQSIVGQPLRKPVERVSAGHGQGYIFQYEMSEVSSDVSVQIEGLSANVNLSSQMQS